MLSSSPVDALAFVGWGDGPHLGGQLDLKPVSVVLCVLWHFLSMGSVF